MTGNNLFAGLTFCHCGGRMWVPSNTPKYVCKACRNKVPQADLERVFQEQLKAFFLSPEEVAGALSQADQEVQAKVDLLDALRREADRLKAEADEVFRLYLAKEITARALGERHQPIEDRRVELEAEIPRLQGEIDFLKIQHLSREEVVSEAEDLYDRWEELTPHDRRAIIQAIVERVTVGKDEIEITLSCLLRPPEPPLPPPLQDAGNLCTHPHPCVHHLSCHPARTDSPPWLPRDADLGRGAPEEGPPRPGPQAPRHGLRDRLLHGEPRHVGDGRCGAHSALLAQDPWVPRLRPPAGARGLWWAD